MTKDLIKVGKSIMVMPLGDPFVAPIGVVTGYTPKENGDVWLVIFVQGDEWFINPDLCVELPEEKLYCNVFQEIGHA